MLLFTSIIFSNSCAVHPAMSKLRAFLFSTLILDLLVITPSVAQTTASNALSSSVTVSAAITSSPAPLVNDPGGSPSENPAPQNPDTAGASGESETAITLSSGDQIAIGVVVSLVVFLGITSAILFYIAKRRQWEVRATIRRSARRFTTAVRARTPIKPNFSSGDRAGIVEMDRPSEQSVHKNKDRSKRSGGILKEGKARPERINTSADRDVEKGVAHGLGTQTTIEALSKPSPSPPQAGTKSSFEMDSPLTGNQAGVGKSGGGGWKRILRR